MISKELFVKTINFIKHQRECQDTLCDALEKCCPGEYVNAFIYGEYEEQVIKILHEVLELPKDDDILEYWLYDCNFGKDFKIGSIVENKKEIDVSTTEKLYDYIILKYNTTPNILNILKENIVCRDGTTTTFNTRNNYVKEWLENER